MIITDLFESHQTCPECGGPSFSDLILAEKKDACYHKVKASAKVWPSAYASGRLVQCRKKGADNYGNKSEGVMEMDKSQTPPGRDGSNDSDAGKKEYTAKATTPEKVAKDAEKILNKELNKKQGVAEGELDEGWKSALGAAAIAGTMAMGGGAHARVSGDYVDNPEINRLTGQPKVTQQISPDAAKPAAAKPGFSKEYLQSVVDGTHPRPLISKERAQELLQQQTTNEQSKQQKGADYRDPPEADYGDDYQDMVARVKKLAGLGPLKTVYDPAKRVYRNVPTAVQPKK